MMESIFCTLFKVTVTSIILIAIPNLSPDGVFTSYSIEPPVELQGSYTLNTVLNDAEHLHSGLIKGPESLAVVDGELYTGIHGGYVVKLSEGKVEKIVKFGQPCEGQWQEEKCGRPFGLAAGKKEGDLYVTDAYYGVWKYNIRDETKECLVSQNVSIEGRTPKLFNGIFETDNGDIYWTDSSSDVGIQNGLYAMFIDGSGRLLKYSAETKNNVVILDNLYFPNGIVMSPDRSFIVIAEMITSRLIRHYIDGPSKGKTDIFLDKIPGFPDKLKVHGDNILVPLVHSRDKSEPVMFQYLAPYPLVRKGIVRLMGLVEGILTVINSVLPATIFEKAIHMIGHFEPISMFGPERVTILVVNWDGEVMESWHNLDETLTAISDVQIHKGFVYYGSPYNQYVGRTLIPNVTN